MSRSVDRACGVPDCPDLGSGFVRPVVRVFWSAQGGARLSRSLGVQEYTYGPWSAQTRRLSVRVSGIRTTRYARHFTDRAVRIGRLWSAREVKSEESYPDWA